MRTSSGSTGMSQCSSMVNLKIDTSFVGIGVLRFEISVLDVYFASISKQELWLFGENFAWQLLEQSMI